MSILDRLHGKWIRTNAPDAKNQRICEAVLFFNPAAWVLSRRISRLREYCCDQQASQVPNMAAEEARVRYAQALLNTVQLSVDGSSSRAPMTSPSAIAKLSCIEERTDTSWVPPRQMKLAALKCTSPIGKPGIVMASTRRRGINLTGILVQCTSYDSDSSFPLRRCYSI
jgi:hypothetical protein